MNEMQMFSVNRHAEMFQRDRSTIVRALRGVPRDGGSADRPTSTAATVSRALEQHFATKSGGANAVSHDLERQFAELERRYDAVRAAPTLDERRALARMVFFPFLASVETAMYADAKRGGEDPRLTHLRVAEHTRLNVFTLRDALGWSRNEAWTEFMKADPRASDDE